MKYDRPYLKQQAKGLMSTAKPSPIAAGAVYVALSALTGFLSSRLVGVPGASDVLHEAHVTYSDDVKRRVLGVREETLAAHTAVSAETAVCVTGMPPRIGIVK